MKTNDLITRYLDGLTSPEEERQLRATLEAKTTLTADERAVLDLLCLSFPEEDTAALLTEDVSQSTNHHSQFFIRRLVVVSGIAAAVILAFLLWPENHEVPIKHPEQHPVIAEVAPPKPVPKEKVEAEMPVPAIAETHTKAMPVSITKRPPMRKLVAQATAIATTEEKVQSVIIDAKPVVVEEMPQRGEPPIPSDRQALVDIYLAEAALQVAYQRRAQAEALRAYSASLEGKETPPAQPIIAF